MSQTELQRPLRVFLTGYRATLTDLCDGLARQPGIDFVGAARSVAESERTIGAGDLDVVIQAAEGMLPRGELAAIRERTHVPIVLLVERPDPGLFDAALYVDVSDIVILPEPAERVAFTLRKVARLASRRGSDDRPRAHTMTVFSPKGGTGKTVVAVNLASTLGKQEGLRTLLIDLDLQFGDASIMLGVQPQHTLHELARAGGELDVRKLGGYLTRHSGSGVDVLAAPLRPEDGEQITDADIERLLSVAQSAYDAIVVDTSPFFHGPMLSTLETTDDLIVVCSPEVPALKNVRLGVETLRLLKFPDERMRLCLNRADSDVGVRRPEVESVLGIPVAFELPFDAEVPAAVNRGTPPALSAPASPFSQAVLAMARSLLKGGRAGGTQPGEHGGERSLVATVRGLAAGLLPSREDKAGADTAEGQA